MTSAGLYALETIRTNNNSDRGPTNECCPSCMIYFMPTRQCQTEPRVLPFQGDVNGFPSCGDTKDRHCNNTPGRYILMVVACVFAAVENSFFWMIVLLS